MTATVALARAELVMFARNRVAAATGVVLPLAASAWLITSPPPADVPGGIAGGITALVLLFLTGMTVTATATTTLVARRQQHLLERWRVSGAPTLAVLAGTLAPAVLLLTVGATIMFAATGYAMNTVPARPALLVIALILAAVLGCAVAFVTAAFTRTVEAAQITLFPALSALLGGGFWVLTVPADTITWPMRATGGGALTELLRIGWNGAAEGQGSATSLVAAGPSVLALIGLSAALIVVAGRVFRWQARG